VRYHDSQGEYEVAKQYAEEIENCVRKYGSNNRKLASALLEHAAALQNLGKYDVRRFSLEIARSKYPDNILILICKI
jgi:TolA-binding protein